MPTPLPTEDAKYLLNLFQTPKLIGLISDANQGKSNLLYWVLKTLAENYNFKLYSYGLRARVKGEQKIHSVEELEVIHDSIIIVDEFASMFDVDDRKEKRQIEQTLRLIFHNNNVVLLSGLPENFKKFISSKLDAVLLKRCALKDAINGSRVKQIIYNYRGAELGAAVLNVKLEEALVYDGTHYHRINIPYLPEYDTKANNITILEPKPSRKVRK